VAHSDVIGGGLLAVFSVNTEGTLGEMWQPAPGVGWSYWAPFGIDVGGVPAVGRNLDGRLEVFAIGADGRLGHVWQLTPGDMNEWSPWSGLGAELQSDPAVIANADGRLEVFAIGPDGCLGHVWQIRPEEGGGWSKWDSFGHAIIGPPTPSVNDQGRLEVFAIGADGCLGHVWQMARADDHLDWSDWSSFGSPLQSQPAVAVSADGRLEVFAIGLDGRLGHAWQFRDAGGAKAWSRWDSFGVAVSGPPAVSRNSSGQLEVFGLGPDGRLGHIWQRPGEGWSEWSSFGIEIHGQPKVVINRHGGLEVFAVGSRGRLGHVWQWEGVSDWSHWEDLGPPIADDRFAVCQIALPAGLGHPIGLATPAAAVVGTAAVLGTEKLGRSSAHDPNTVRADFCVIGAGPAGITVSNGLLRAGASVVLVESGDWNEDDAAQELNHGDADGPIIKDYLNYLRRARRRQVQGSAAGWGRGWCMPFRAIDFEPRPWVAHSGWPLARNQLVAYEQRAAATFGFDPFAEPVADGPLVRLTYQYPPYDLLFRSMLLEQLARPEFRLELGATAVRLTVGADRVESVRCARLGQPDLHVEAQTFVLALGGIENARLLLLHEMDLPAGEMVGRCFMEHPHVVSATVSLPDVDAIRPYLDSGRQLDVLGLPDGVQRDERLLGASVQLRPSGQTAPSSGPIECHLFARAEQAPNPESRVLLGQLRDRNGCPQPHLQWRLLDQDWESLVRTVELVATALESRYNAAVELLISSDSPWPWDPAGPAESPECTWGNHHLGTTRMAVDPAEGVVDTNCLVHGTANLYIAGSSVFPTGGCANPTFMIVTLAHRLVDHLASYKLANLGPADALGASH
jgi:GMC oxidoreductase